MYAKRECFHDKIELKFQLKRNSVFRLVEI